MFSGGVEWVDKAKKKKKIFTQVNYERYCFHINVKET